MCDCQVCQRGREVQAQLALLAPQQRAFFEAMHDALEHIEMDRDYYRAVLDGSWPNADEVLAGFRARRAAKQAEEPSPAVGEG